MKIHFCTKDPCPVEDKEITHVIENGMRITYTNELLDRIEKGEIFNLQEDASS